MENLTEKSALRTFNETIKIEIALDTIAQMLLEKMDQNSPVKDLLVDQIIGSLRHAPSGISRLYNALIGHPNRCAYSVGDEIYISKNEFNTFNWHKSMEPVKAVKAVILAIDEFAARPLSIRYEYINRDFKIVSSEASADFSSIKEKDELIDKLITKVIQAEEDAPY